MKETCIKCDGIVLSVTGWPLTWKTWKSRRIV